MRRVFVVFAKLLGLLQIYWGLSYLVSITFFMRQMSDMGGFSPFFGLALYCVLSFGIAWILLLRTEWLADKLDIKAEGPEFSMSADATLRVGMKIAGAFMLAKSLPNFVKFGCDLALLETFNSYLAAKWINVVPIILKIVFSLLLLIRTSFVVGLIAKGEAAPGKRVAFGSVFLLAAILFLSHGVSRFAVSRQRDKDSFSVTDKHSVPPRDRSEDSDRQDWYRIPSGPVAVATNLPSDSTNAANRDAVGTFEVKVAIPL
jgi:hypothetical protein